ETAFSKVETDRDRVEVTPERRKVIHCSRSVVAANGAPLGYVVLTVYAEPILAAVRDFAPSPGVESFVLDAEGQSLDAMDSDSIEPATLASDERRALIRRALDDGVARDRAGNLVVAHEVANSPLLFSLVSFVPAAVRNETRAKLGGEYLWAVGSTVLVALVLVLAALFYVRMSERGFRLVESENYLEQIRRESAKYRALLDGSADMILVVDPAVGWVRECNHGARSELGIIEGETDAASILRDSDRETFRASLLRAEDQPGQIAATGEYWVKNQKGEDRLVEARFVGIELDDGPAVQVSFRDRTEQKDMERRVGTVERLSSLGLVTAGVAHEINNPLAAIANYLALLEKESADEDKRQRYVRLVRHGFDRIRAIVKDLLRFARPRESGGSTDLTEAAHRAAGLLTYAGGNADIDVCLQDLERPVFVAGEDGGIEQVILNLLLNASNAMQGKGRIVVSWRHETDRELGGPVIDLVVEDEGPGIDPDALEKIFDPFFTSGSGTGLGLSVSFGIVRAFGGRLWAENCSGRGARFVVRLPTADAEARRP
ncbi:MAG: hypothetical protein KDB53_16030, partial [Planctomycetes bacterium]|nr:hypothetical protein [Planctomycetota bacterium]